MKVILKSGKYVNIRVTKNNDIYEYYIGEIKIGVYDPKVMEDNILILQNTLENEMSNQIKDAIDGIDKNKIKKEAEQDYKIEEYAREIGVERIKNITIFELKKESKKEKESEKKKDNEEEVKHDIDTQNLKTRANEINIKQEINLSERANDMHDLRKWLGGKLPPEFKKIAVIEGSDMNKMKNENGKNYNNTSTRYALAVIDKNGNIEPLQKYIPNLRQRSAAGNNPSQLKYQVDKNGKVEKDAILSEYEIGDKIIQIDNKEMGRVQLNIGYEEHGGNETLGVQMRDSNSTFATSTEVRSVMGEYEINGEYTVNKNLEEAKKHGNCDKLTYEDIDGDENTQSHSHIDGDEDTIDEER